LELIRGEIEQEHPGAVLDTSFDRGQAAMLVDPGKVLAVLGWLRDAPGQEYRFLSSLHAADYLPAQPRFGVHYELLNRNRRERLRVKAMLGDPSAGPVAAGDPPPPAVAEASSGAVPPTAPPAEAAWPPCSEAGSSDSPSPLASSFKRLASLSAARRAFTKMIVDVCSWTSSRSFG
jgi:hypothetical protein